jgi:uncharacterized cupin superfamily protein
MSNLNDPEFDEHRDHPGFQALRARIGRQVGAERLGLSLWEIPPGQVAYPYHYHLGEEELIVILRGRPSLRTPAGWRELPQGRSSRSSWGRRAPTRSSTAPMRRCACSRSARPERRTS